MTNITEENTTETPVKLCNKHPRFQGKKKPTTLLRESDGCTCHTAYETILSERSTEVTIECHVAGFIPYNGHPTKTWNQRVEAKDVREIAKKVFLQEKPGIGVLLRIYATVGGEKTFLCAVGAQASINITPSHTTIKASSREHFISRKETLSPRDIHKV